VAETVKNLIALAFRISTTIIVFGFLAGKRLVIISELKQPAFSFFGLSFMERSKSDLINPVGERVSFGMTDKT
jgi:hypothetical protein